MYRHLTKAETSPSSSSSSLPLWSARWVARLAEYTGIHQQASWRRRYAVATAAVALALLLRIAFDPLMGTRAAYGFFMVATAFVAWRHGLGPAIYTLFTGAFLGWWAFERKWHAELAEADLVPIVMSITIGLVTVLVCESLRVVALDNARLYYEARQSVQRKDEFLAMLAHELRNPLAPIRNALYLWEQGRPDAAESSELRELVATQVEHLVRLVDDLLDVARISRGRLEIRKQAVDLKTILDAAVTAARPTIEEFRHQLFVDIPTQPMRMSGDPVRLTQVFTNLLNNAAKYTDKGGRIWLTAEMDGDAAVVKVRDTGVGMTDEQLGRVFRLFEQADPSIERSRGGLGIGLTLAANIIDLHGGKLHGDSAGLGQGCEFSVRLPGVSVEPVAPPSAEAVPVAKRRTPGSLRVLVVEDLVASAQSLSKLLTLWRHEVEIAHDGFTALDKARSFRPDVVLTDLGMPQMSGFRLAEELNSQVAARDAILIAVSGYGQAGDLARSQAAGFYKHLTKPIDPDALRAVLDEIADERRTASAGA